MVYKIKLSCAGASVFERLPCTPDTWHFKMLSCDRKNRAATMKHSIIQWWQSTASVTCITMLLLPFFRWQIYYYALLRHQWYLYMQIWKQGQWERTLTFRIYMLCAWFFTFWGNVRIAKNLVSSMVHLLINIPTPPGSIFWLRPCSI